MESKSSFNENLKAKMTAAGFTDQEQILGTLTAEFKAGLGMLQAAGGSGPMVVMATMALSATFSKLLAYVTKDKATAMKVVAASDMVVDACAARAAAEHCPIHGAECDGEQSDSRPRPALAIVRNLDASRPTDPKDIN